MLPQDFVTQLLAVESLTDQKDFLEEHRHLYDDEPDQLAEELKAQADHFLRANLKKSSEIADLLIHLSTITGDQSYRALALRAQANIECIGRANYPMAIELCDEAVRIYQGDGRDVDAAKAQLVTIMAYSHSGDYVRASQIFEMIQPVFLEHQLWFWVGRATANMATAYGRKGEDTKALKLFEDAGEFFQKANDEGSVALVKLNLGVIHCRLGHFEQSIHESSSALEELSRSGQNIPIARTQQSLANTYIMQGHYNKGIQLLELARDTFLLDERLRDALVVDLFMSECLLQIQRYTDALNNAIQMQKEFAKLQAGWETARATLNEAMAYVGLKLYKNALDSLVRARDLFTKEGNDAWINATELEIAAVQYGQNNFDASLTMSLKCATLFKTTGHLLKEADAYLIAARASIALNQLDRAAHLLNQAISIGTAQDIPFVLYQVYHLQGKIAHAQQHIAEALAYYTKSIEQIERLRRTLMIEFRADFQMDKQIVYEDVVRLCVECNLPLQGLEYAERAKSQTLIDLLAYRFDISIQAKDSKDIALIQQLEELQAKRNHLHRRWEIGEEYRTNVRNVPDATQEIKQDILALEEQITILRNKLLVRNANYAQDIGLQQIQIEEIQPYIPSGVLLIEYFIAGQTIFVFAATQEKVEVKMLSCKTFQIDKLIRRFQFNLSSVSNQELKQALDLLPNAQRRLQQLYEFLIQPIAPILKEYTQLIIVPHGPLHYLPFHALYDGAQFLIERHEISYLPGASMLRYLQNNARKNEKVAAFGYSMSGQLSETVHEVHTIAQLMETEVFLEEKATLAQLQEVSPDCHLLHLATHGEFRSDNPLFSGLILADEPLTTLKVFNLQLNASLVTLSACQTGRHVVGGGDELLGLMRAFLHAGAASLVLSLWSVEDRSTAEFMHLFYSKLAQGWTKAAALRHAQLQFIHQKKKGIYAHPYFWAPFYLVGNFGAL